MDEYWVITWGQKRKDGTLQLGDLRTDVIPAFPWLWLEAKMDEKHERMKNFAVANGKQIPPRPNDLVLIGCWKLRDIG